ncbi:hypothetical protein Rsub_01178 [Raphidocelis subcapitata]|uniref:Uncharacterized protein n=1 Tax=Raphidocelis subcapitata TaxID=307507 RepID=A0A2V0NUG5_9CHLO|nr:hypothetical protein Rsub_01178 [Raphidocelis subcapitata]|eukprot:GBF88465.1 hypothetical protein Rsub_01178 [Raphidocelis subcapitata]
MEEQRGSAANDGLLSARSDDTQPGFLVGNKRLALSMSLSGKLDPRGGDAASSDLNGALDSGKRTPTRATLADKMQRLLKLKTAGSSGLADAPPSPAARAASPFSRSLDASMFAAAEDGAPDTPTAGKAGRTSRQGGRSTLWGKLGSGMKSRKTSPATAAARSSFEGASAVELPLPSNGSGSAAAAGCGPAGDDGGSYDPRGDGDGGEASRCGSPSGSSLAGGVFVPPGGGNYCDETLDLRHALAAGYVMEGVCGTPPSMPSGLEAMPDYLLTPGVREILGEAPAPRLPTPELPGGGGAAGWRRPAFDDGDATVALLPAAELARAGYGGGIEPTVALAAAAAEAAPKPARPAAKPAAEPAAEPAAKPVAEPAAKPVAELAAAAAPAEPEAAAAVEPAVPQQPEAAGEAEAPPAAAVAPAEVPSPAAEAPAPLAALKAPSPAAKAASPVARAPSPTAKAPSPVAAPKAPSPVAAPKAPSPVAAPKASSPVAAASPAAAAAPSPAAGPKAASPAAAAPPSVSPGLRLSEEPDSTGPDGRKPPAARGVRESIPLFVLQPSALPGAASGAGGAAGGGAGAGDAEGDLLRDDADVDDFLACAGAGAGDNPVGGRRSSVGRLGAGAQRVQPAAAAAAAGGFVSRLETVSEAPMSMPDSEEPESPLAHGAGTACSTPASLKSPVPAAEAPQRQHQQQPAPQQPSFAEVATPMSTPGAPRGAAGAGGGGSPSFMTPEAGEPSPDSKAAAVAAAVAAARGDAGFGSPGTPFESPLEAGPAGRLARAGGRGSPTLALCGADATLSTLSGPELLARVGGPAQAQAKALKPDPATPAVNLLDRAAPSPSAVYHARLEGTPFVQAAAADVDAARRAPLVDSSPFDLGDMDTMVFREDLEKVCQNLAGSPGGSPAAAAAGGPPSPSAAAPQAPGSPAAAAAAAAAAALAAGAVAGADALLVAQLRVMTQKAAGFERQLREAQVEGEQLKEQLATLEFEKTELGQQDEFEREARLFAEEQLATAQREGAGLRQQLATHQQLLGDVRNELAALRQERAASEARWAQERREMEAKAAQVTSELDAALDRLNFQDMRLTALGGANSELQGALAAEQARVEQAGRQLAAKDQDLARMAHELSEARAQTEKAVEQVCSANMATEQALAKAQSDRARLDEALAQLAAQSGLAAERERLTVQLQHHGLLKQKYAQKSGALKETQARLAAKEQELAEVMAMCDQLLAAQEAARGGGGAAAQ